MPLTQYADTLPRRYGRYTLVSSLGRGGMAEVFLASVETLPGTRRLVALKRIHPHLVADKSFVQMFFDEARVLMGLSHPNLDRIIDVGEVDGVPYMALDYVPGRDLSAVLKQHENAGPLPLEVCTHVVAKVAGGLAHAHARRDEAGRSLGIVHRDVTPENVIVTFDGGVKLLDFGVALGTMRAQVTAPGLIKGKPAYMAPEQLLARKVDARADVFALGVLLYRLSVGRLPFDVVSSDPATYRRLLDDLPPPPHLLRPDYPRSLSVVVMKALEKSVERRYPSASALQTDLEEVMAEQGWFPTERRLAQLMGSLFPGAALAARRFSENPADAEAAQEASYLAPGLAPEAPQDHRLLDDFEADGSDDPTTVGEDPFDTRLLETDEDDDDATVTATPDFEDPTLPPGPAPFDTADAAYLETRVRGPADPLPEPQARTAAEPPGPSTGDPFLDARLASASTDESEPTVSQQETRTSQSPFIVEPRGAAEPPAPEPGRLPTTEAPTAPRAVAPGPRRVSAVPPSRGGPASVGRRLLEGQGPVWKRPLPLAATGVLLALALLGFLVCG